MSGISRLPKKEEGKGGPLLSRSLVHPGLWGPPHNGAPKPAAALPWGPRQMEQAFREIKRAVATHERLRVGPDWNIQI